MLVAWLVPHQHIALKQGKREKPRLGADASLS